MKKIFVSKVRIFSFRRWTRKKYAVFNSLKRIIKICTLAVIYTIIAKPGHLKAQSIDTSGNKVYELDEVVVQSTLIGQKDAETGRSIEVIQGIQLQNLPVTSIDELLRYVPGLEGKSRNSFGVQTDFSIRGSNFNQVLVLIDGIKINDPLTAHFNSNIPVTPSEIERIEIIRGPASAEYGPDATGGIINIITKTFSPKKQTSLINADAKLFLGQQNLISSQAGFTYAGDKFRLGGGFLYNKSDGQLLQTGLRSNFNINTLSISGRIQINPAWSIALRSSRDYRDFNAQRFYTSLSIDTAYEKIERYRQQLELIRESGKYISTLNAGVLNTNDDFSLYPAAVHAINKTQLINIQLNQNIVFNEKLTLATGTFLDQRSILSNNRGNHSIFHTGFFTWILIKPVDHLAINSGLRADYDQSYGLHLIPQVSLSYQPLDRLLLRASAGKSIRSADFTENYYNNEVKYPLSANQRLGNPFLKAEESWSAETGFNYNIIPAIVLDVTIFNRWSTNLIDYSRTSAQAIKNNSNLLIDSSYLYALNISNLNTLGLETRMCIRKNISNRLKFSFIGGFTIMQSENSDSILSLYISSNAKQLVNAEFMLEYGPVSFSINGLYKERDTKFASKLNLSLSPYYTVWNASSDLRIYKNIISLSIAVNNIFDERYSDILGAEMPHRWIMGGIKVKY